MKCKDQNNYHKIESKHKTKWKKFNYFLVISEFRKQKTIKRQIISKFKIKKNRYVKIDEIFSVTKEFISNEADPSCVKSRNPKN